MTEYVTGQIYGWNGGECPVHPKTKIEVWFRNGYSTLGCSGGWVWTHDDDATDIVCFKVITPYDEPKVIYVNEYYDGSGAAYATEEAAQAGAGISATRVAVKYVEVKE